MSKQEVLKRVLKESPKFLFPLSILAVSLLNVSFLKSDKGFDIIDEGSFDKLSDPEQRVARKLLSLGIKIGFELIHIRLDNPVEVAGKHKKTGRPKTKRITTPDFNFTFNGVTCYLEIGSGRATSHKRRQFKVMERAVDLDKTNQILYVQLFKEDINIMEECVETIDDLLAFLYEHELAIYTR